MSSAEDSIPLSRPAVGERELEMLRGVLESGWLAGGGPRGRDLAAGIAATAGRAHGVVVSSCTAGLHLALLGVGVGPGDDVLIADYTFPATAMAVAHAGGNPVSVDVRRETGAIDLDAAAAAMTESTRAMIVVDPLGLPADWAEVEAFCERRGITVIADSACSLGASYRGRGAGHYGHVAVFSLHARKGVTGGEGGVLVTDDEQLAHRVASLAAFGMAQDPGDDRLGRTLVPFTSVGFNYKLDELSAAVALAQLERLEVNVDARTTAAGRYAAMLSGLPGLELPQVPSDRTHAWQTYAVTVADDLDRDGVVARLRADGIGCTIGTYAVSGLGLFGTPAEVCPTSNRLFRQQLSLPMFAGISAEQQERVAQSLGRAVGALSRS